MSAPILTQASAEAPKGPSLAGVYRWRRTIAIVLAVVLALPVLVELWQYVT